MKTLNKKILLSFLGLTLFIATIAKCQAASYISAEEMYRAKPWSVLIYRGTTAKEVLGRLLRFQYHGAGETLYSAELAYTLSEANFLRKLLHSIVSVVQVGTNLTVRFDHDDPSANPEGNIYLIFRWVNFPWNKYLVTSLAAAEGISYASHVPQVEQGITSTDSRRLLNYLMFEATFATPSHPEFEIVARIHHRSVAYGLFGDGNCGSNTIGIGFRYHF
jgi:hypothetical protein